MFPNCINKLNSLISASVILVDKFIFENVGNSWRQIRFAGKYMSLFLGSPD